MIITVNEENIVVENIGAFWLERRPDHTEGGVMMYWKSLHIIVGGMERSYGAAEDSKEWRVLKANYERLCEVLDTKRI